MSANVCSKRTCGLYNMGQSTSQQFFHENKLLNFIFVSLCPIYSTRNVKCKNNSLRFDMLLSVTLFLGQRQGHPAVMLSVSLIVRKSVERLQHVSLFQTNL